MLMNKKSSFINLLVSSRICSYFFKNDCETAGGGQLVQVLANRANNTLPGAVSTTENSSGRRLDFLLFLRCGPDPYSVLNY